MALANAIPILTKFKKLRFVPKSVENFFIDLMEQSIRLREEQQQKGLNGDRVDFMNYMLQLKQKKNLSLPEVTSHTMTFLLDGFETTSTVLAHCLLLVGSLFKKFFFYKNPFYNFSIIFSLAAIPRNKKNYVKKSSKNWMTVTVLKPLQNWNIWMPVFMVKLNY